MENLRETKVSKIVAENFKTARVFTDHGIDFCCNGGIPLEEACSIKGVDLERVLNELSIELAERDAKGYKDMREDDLIDHIVRIHHSYVKTTTGVLLIYLEKLCQVHGGRHPELFDVFQEMKEASQALTDHMSKEEMVLFPYIKAMVRAEQLGEDLPESPFGSVENPIKMMEEEHDQEGARFRRISAITDGYTAPKDGCQTYQVAYKMLSEFERDLHEHVHLENNILFPKAGERYARLKRA